LRPLSRSRKRAGVRVVDNRLTPVARELRRNQTSAERNLWKAIHARKLKGFRFRRQAILCGFVVDFACYEARLVVEADGAAHSTEAEAERDARRDAMLKANGNSVLRFTNDEVFHNIDHVLETTRLKLNELRPRVTAVWPQKGAKIPSPLWGRGKKGERIPSPQGRGKKGAAWAR